MDRTESRRLVRILLPYMALWCALAGTLAAFATYETAKSRTHAIESAQAELESIAWLASEHALQTLSGVDRSLETVRMMHERRLTSTSLAELLPAFAGNDIERRISLFDRDGRFVASSGPVA